jgi:hypothetical protein
MTDTARREYAIRVENLGYAPQDKRYQLGPRGYGAAKSAIAAATASVGAVSTGGSFRESMSSLFRRNSHSESHPASSHQYPASSNQYLASQQDFWALQDINFEIKRGEADASNRLRHK